MPQLHIFQSPILAVPLVSQSFSFYMIIIYIDSVPGQHAQARSQHLCAKLEYGVQQSVFPA